MIWGYSGQDATDGDIKGCVGPGWGPLLERLVADLKSLGWDGTLMQVKEKFGGLRFYIGSASDEVHDRIADAELESYTICERCGAPGKLRTDGWWRVLCDECEEKRK